MPFGACTQWGSNETRILSRAKIPRGKEQFGDITRLIVMYREYPALFDYLQRRCELLRSVLNAPRCGQDSHSVRMTEDRDKWRKYVHGVANPRIEDG